jgi:hypothetical protein
VLFVDCWSVTNVTNPSHTALFTGLSPRDTRLVDDFTRLGERAQTLAECFSPEELLMKQSLIDKFYPRSEPAKEG